MLPFWERVKGLLNEDLTQSWLCREIEISTGTMSSWITNKRIPRADVAAKIAKALGVTVHYLVTGEDDDDLAGHAAIVEVVRNAMKGKASIKTPQNQTYQFNIHDQAIFVPLYDQVVSAGSGAEFLDDAIPSCHIPIPKHAVQQYGSSDLFAAMVRGDSMIGAYLYDGDYVVCAKGLIRGNGIYVLTIRGELLVKRLAFDQVHKEMHIHSDNPRYQTPIIIPIDSEGVRIEGAVIAWFHTHPY